VPLFVEELTKSVLESSLLHEEEDRYVLDGALPPFAIPTTLHASLLARLDRLASVRLVAQIGAAIGREFSYALLHAVSRLPKDELHASLARLVASELVFQRGTPPDAVYSFAETSERRRQLWSGVRFAADSPVEEAGFELVWGFSYQVVVFGLLPVLCSELESRSSFFNRAAGGKRIFST